MATTKATAQISATTGTRRSPITMRVPVDAAGKLERIPVEEVTIVTGLSAKKWREIATKMEQNPGRRDVILFQIKTSASPKIFPIYVVARDIERSNDPEQPDRFEATVYQTRITGTYLPGDKPLSGDRGRFGAKPRA